jgi:hemerythrin-like domain-containing protein
MLLTGGALLLAGCSKVASSHVNAPGDAAAREEDDATQSDDDSQVAYAVSPAEDLLREHGVTQRLLLIFEEGARRIETNQELPTDPFLSALDIARRFVDEYHARVEEEQVFPQFERAQRLGELIPVLRRQHRVAARISEQLAQSFGSGAAETPAARGSTIALLRSYARMQRAHEARESTLLIPAMRAIMTAGAFDALYDAVKQKETAVLGADGLFTVIDEIAALERTLEIRDLDRFTPQV